MKEKKNTFSTIHFTFGSCGFCLTVSGPEGGKRNRPMFLQVSSPRAYCSSVHPVGTLYMLYIGLYCMLLRPHTTLPIWLTEPLTRDSTVSSSCCSEAYIAAMFNLQKCSFTFRCGISSDVRWYDNIGKSVPVWREISCASSEERGTWSKASKTVPGFKVKLFSVNQCRGKGKFHQNCTCFFER